MELKTLYDEYYALLDSLPIVPPKSADKIIAKHKRLLDQLDVVNSGAMSIFDLQRKEHIYLSSKYTSLFGYDVSRANAEGNAYMDHHVLDEDLPKLLQAGIYFMRFAMHLNSAEQKNYKMITSYRIVKSTGETIPVIEQYSCLETDAHGHLWLGLGVMDMAPLEDVHNPFTARALNFKTGALYHFPPKQDIGSTPLSERENEILTLIAQGLISKEIADKLYISVNTVNTHRQRIIEKLNVSNTFEAISYAKSIGLINSPQ